LEKNLTMDEKTIGSLPADHPTHRSEAPVSNPARAPDQFFV
jgi:hypothetical protein